MTLGEERPAVPARRRSQRQQRLDLRSDENVPTVDGVVQRLDTEAVAHRDQAASTLISDHYRELPRS